MICVLNFSSIYHLYSLDKHKSIAIYFPILHFNNITHDTPFHLCWKIFVYKIIYQLILLDKFCFKTFVN